MFADQPGRGPGLTVVHVANRTCNSYRLEKFSQSREGWSTALTVVGNETSTRTAATARHAPISSMPGAPFAGTSALPQNDEPTPDSGGPLSDESYGLVHRFQLLLGYPSCGALEGTASHCFSLNPTPDSRPPAWSVCRREPTRPRINKGHPFRRCPALKCSSRLGFEALQESPIAARTKEKFK
jgi:hypothetical protein